MAEMAKNQSRSSSSEFFTVMWLLFMLSFWSGSYEFYCNFVLLINNILRAVNLQTHKGLLMVVYQRKNATMGATVYSTCFSS